MINNFNKILRKTLEYEGGFSNHPNDPGGATNKGITLRTFSRYLGRQATVEELKNISDETVGAIYKAFFWDEVKATFILSGVDAIVFDFCVNSGPYRAVKTLQKIVKVKEDGVIGMGTLKAVNDYVHKNGVTQLINQYQDERLKYLRSLPTFTTFGKGWTRRVNDLRAFAIGMVL